jgi:redox-sensitive bicupin YhaK (pirin superfamily)
MSTLDFVLEGKTKDLGDGFTVKRLLPVAQRRAVGPFVFFDHMGPVDFKVGNGLDVRPHPHIGLSTLTYLFEGSITHRDTLGVEMEIRPGAVNWMTAGSGVAHSERSPQQARVNPQRLHGLQLWVALPKEKEDVAPSFDHYAAKDIPEFRLQGCTVRVVVGHLERNASPVRASSPMIYLDLDLAAGGSFETERPNDELAVYVVSGCVVIDGTSVPEGSLGVLKSGAQVRLKASEKSRVVVIGGEPLAEPRHIWWNFVSSSKQRIERAKEDWRSGRFGRIRGETEFIPLPER